MGCCSTGFRGRRFSSPSRWEFRRGVASGRQARREVDCVRHAGTRWGSDGMSARVRPSNSLKRHRCARFTQLVGGGQHPGYYGAKSQLRGAPMRTLAERLKEDTHDLHVAAERHPVHGHCSAATGRSRTSHLHAADGPGAVGLEAGRAVGAPARTCGAHRRAGGDARRRAGLARRARPARRATARSSPRSSGPTMPRRWGCGTLEARRTAGGSSRRLGAGARGVRVPVAHAARNGAGRTLGRVQGDARRPDAVGGRAARVVEGAGRMFRGSSACSTRSRRAGVASRGVYARHP